MGLIAFGIPDYLTAHLKWDIMKLGIILVLTSLTNLLFGGVRNLKAYLEMDRQAEGFSFFATAHIFF